MRLLTVLTASGLAAVVEPLEARLADPAVDVVHPATPDRLRQPQVEQVLGAGGAIALPGRDRSRVEVTR